MNHSSRSTAKRHPLAGAPHLATALVAVVGLSCLVAIVIGGLMFMCGEGGAERQISGIVFGGGLALFAAQFMTWLF